MNWRVIQWDADDSGTTTHTGRVRVRVRLTTCAADVCQVDEPERSLCHTPASRHQHGRLLPVGGASLWRPWWRQQSRDCRVGEGCTVTSFLFSPAFVNNVTCSTDVWTCLQPTRLRFELNYKHFIRVFAVWRCWKYMCWKTNYLLKLTVKWPTPVRDASVLRLSWWMVQM